MLQLLASLCVSLALAQDTPENPVLEPVLPDAAFTSYELLDPASRSFRIVYDVTASEAGSSVFRNPVRPGSKVSDVSVTLLRDGSDLPHEHVSEGQAEFLDVQLPEAIPSGGGTRLRIAKTYRDPASYYGTGETIHFERRLSILKNQIVLPQGFALRTCNVPVQVLRRQDENGSRVIVSFIRTGPEAWNVKLSAAPVKERLFLESSDATQEHEIGAPQLAVPYGPASHSVAQRATQTRDIAYFLQTPESHAFRLYHDYTEVRPGVGTYVNTVRPGSRASDVLARNLDTGENLTVESFRGEAIRRGGFEFEGEIKPDSEAIVIRFDPVQAGHSTRIRITETYVDTSRYGLKNGELYWHRSLGRAQNRIVLPKGWNLTGNSIPATVKMTADGRVQLDYANPRPDLVDTIIHAVR